jgi:hypothetical protein
MRYFYLLFVCMTMLLFFSSKQKEGPTDKISGVNYVSPSLKTSSDEMKALDRIHANWVAICPFAFLYPGKPEIEYNSAKNWWGDTPEGICKLTKDARIHNLKVFLKPHFWCEGQGWPGEFDLPSQAWNLWETNYSGFMLKMAHLADSLKIEMLCIGTEFKTAVRNHPTYWSTLIDTLRKVYNGKLIYAANWDEYEQVKFWKKLDYIGVDAYFPLSDEITPDKNNLKKSWLKIIPSLESTANENNKKIIFTEYGYRSIHRAAWKQWEFEYDSLQNSVNLVAQQNAYEALYESTWNESWIAGGFIWKWFDYDGQAGGSQNADYTPQHKPAEQIINEWYSK